jgi:RND family efflux transporter MFP subunit
VKRGQVLALIDGTDARIQSQGDAADVARIEALLAQQERLVERQAQLVKKGFISSNAEEDGIAQRNALREQLAASRARLEASRRQQTKAQVLAPIEGVIESQLVSAGDYVKLGDAMFQLVSNTALRAHLPFPESAQSRLKPGQSVRLSSPLEPNKLIQGSISEIRPMVAEGSRALDVLVNVTNAGGLRAGGSVNAAVLIAAKSDTITVPEQSVVLRPAGKVVYVIDANRAKQRLVEVGAKRDGRIEILSGLQGGETIALDGAGFLTEGANVQVKTPEKAVAR